MRMIHTTCLWCVWHQRWPNPSKKPLRLSSQLQPLTCVWLLQIRLLQCWICQDIWTCVEEINKCHRYTHALAWWISWGPIFSGSWRKNAMAMYLCIISSIIYYLWTAASETDSWLARMVSPENSVRWFTWKCPASRSCGYHPSPLSRTLDFGLQHTQLTLSKMWTWWI